MSHPRRKKPISGHVLDELYLKRLGISISDVAIALVHFIFRNGPVEDMHSRGGLTDADMKILNKTMANRLSYVLELLAQNKAEEFYFLIMCQAFYGRDWDSAEPDRGFEGTIYDAKRDMLQKVFFMLMNSEESPSWFKGILDYQFSWGLMCQAQEEATKIGTLRKERNGDKED